MKKERKKELEAKGFETGDIQDFLGLSLIEIIRSKVKIILEKLKSLYN